MKTLTSSSIGPHGRRDQLTSKPTGGIFALKRLLRGERFLRFQDAFSSGSTVVAIVASLSSSVAAEDFPSQLDQPSCEAEIHEAEAEAGLPVGLLLAIGRTEARFANVVWPWSLNVAGTPARHSSYDKALRHIHREMARGRTNIDVGCLQLNMNWVAKGLAPEDVLDPRFNVRTAAGHLVRLRSKHGTWTAAVGYYHSARATRRQAYVCRVAVEYARILDLPLEADECRTTADAKRDR